MAHRVRAGFGAVALAACVCALSLSPLHSAVLVERGGGAATSASFTILADPIVWAHLSEDIDIEEEEGDRGGCDTDGGRGGGGGGGVRTQDLSCCTQS